MQNLVRSIAFGMKTLLFPLECLLCAAPDSSLCGDCGAELFARPRLADRGNLRIISSISYNESAARVILAMKEDGNRVAREIVQNAIFESTRYLIQGSSQFNRIRISWIPSSPSAIRRRGIDFLEPIALALTLELNQNFPAIHFESNGMLRIKRSVKDQTKLSAVQRNINLADAFEVKGSFNQDMPVLLIDDVVTTGSTLAAAAAALKERNLTVIGAATACATRLGMPIR